MGNASVISALNGWGLVVAAVLSRLFLHEEISAGEIAGILTIIAGTGAVGYWGRQTTDQAFAFVALEFWRFTGVTIVLNLLAVGYTLLHGYRGADIVFAVNAGYLGGISALLQKIFMTPLVEGWGTQRSTIATLLGEPYVYVFLVTSMASFAMIQVAYQFGKAIRVVPTFSSSIIVTPVLGAIMVFHERVNTFQAAGIALILIGIVLLSVYKREPDNP